MDYLKTDFLEAQKRLKNRELLKSDLFTFIDYFMNKYKNDLEAIKKDKAILSFIDKKVIKRIITTIEKKGYRNNKLSFKYDYNNQKITFFINYCMVNGWMQKSYII